MGKAGYQYSDLLTYLNCGRIMLSEGVYGKYRLSSSMAEKIIDILGRGDDREPHECLSKREFQVMQKLASGKTIRQIATDLFISENTVRTYKARILEKMRMNNIAELIRYAIENNLVE